MAYVLIISGDFNLKYIEKDPENQARKPCSCFNLELPGPYVCMGCFRNITVGSCSLYLLGERKQGIFSKVSGNEATEVLSESE